MSEYLTDSLFSSDKSQVPQCSCTIRVAFDSGVDNCFDYLVPDEIAPIEKGQRVEVPFGRKNKLAQGFCVAVTNNVGSSTAKRRFILKTVRRVIDKEPLLDEQLLELAQWISDYYVCPLGQVLAAMVPAAVKKGIGVKTEKLVYLSVEQAKIAEVTDQLRGKKQKRIIELLCQSQAYSADSAVELKTLLADAETTIAPIKKLAENQVIRITRQTILKSLPAIAEGIGIKNGNIVLNDDQNNALTKIDAEIETGQFGVTLLHGVTDSGKTEIYIRAIQKTLAQNKSAIVLLPEIALTAQTVQRFSRRFKNIAVMHCQLTAAQRNGQWQKIKSGNADVVIGARSAVFAPLTNLGLIIVDEEHEPSYKQDTAPRYNGKDVAIKRAQLVGAHCILGSATPSLESLYNCETKKYFSLVSLPKRVMNLAMPEMKLIDMSREVSEGKGLNLISTKLKQHIKQTIDRKEQIILLLNRRGYSNFVFCSGCKHTLQCRNCDVTLTFHRSEKQKNSPGYAMCHYCLAQTLVPKKCPLCGKTLMMIGLGSQRLEEELTQKFPSARAVRVDSDSMRKQNYYGILNEFGSGKIDILLGTQILAKGLHFPNVTLVGIISADTSLQLPDFRANERTFCMISQVAGRTGRSEKKGTVYVQTLLQKQPAIQFAMEHDYKGFVNEELKHRQACKLPPFGRVAIVRMRDQKFDKLTAACEMMAERINKTISANSLEVTVRGPMPSAISRIQRNHRMQIIVQSSRANEIQRLFSILRTLKPIKPAVTTAVDIDPVNLL